MQTVILKEGRSKFGNSRIYKQLPRKKEQQRRKEIQITGVGSSPKDFTQTEQKIIAIMPQTLIEGISGGIYTHTQAGTSKSQRTSTETAGTSKSQRTYTDLETLGTLKYQRTSTETVMTVGTAKSDNKEVTQLHSVGTELYGFLITWSFGRLSSGAPTFAKL